MPLKTTVVATIISNDVGRLPTYQMYRREMNEIILPFPSSLITVQEEGGWWGGGCGWLLLKSSFDISRLFAVDMTAVNLLDMKIRSLCHY